jgi:hypothetical protein
MTIRSTSNITVRFLRLLLLFVFITGNSLAAARAETITLIGEDDWYPYSGLKDGRIRGFAADIVKPRMPLLVFRSNLHRRPIHVA